MTRGIYFMANDRVLDYAIALVNSIRAFDTQTPIVMIPYSKPYTAAAKTLTRLPGVELYDDRRRLQRLMRQVRRIFGPYFFPRPENFRKQFCWFGPFDEFLYLDADIIVFDRVIDMLASLSECDFLCYSDQHLGGITHVFSPKVIEDRVFTTAELQDVFNAGFWASRKGLFSEASLYAG